MKWQAFGRKTTDFWQKEGRLFCSERVMIVSWIFVEEGRHTYRGGVFILE
jgi:hypothetical protein